MTDLDGVFSKGLIFMFWYTIRGNGDRDGDDGDDGDGDDGDGDSLYCFRSLCDPDQQLKGKYSCFGY